MAPNSARVGTGREMKIKSFGFMLLAAVVIGLPAGKETRSTLPARYQKWLTEEVAYIIASRERAVFLALQTDRERDIFIEAFWKQRDPSPGTERNEFKDEHYSRLEYANSMYGRGTPLPGWKTDRGRIYIILGPPKNIESYDHVLNVFPTEIWFYLGDTNLGLPTGFNVIFFKKAGTGDYILYSPTDDGPQSLIADSMSDYRDEQAAYQALKKLEPNLARQTLSLIPNERVQPGYASLASNRLMATIFAAPQKKVDVGYADAILKYKDFVEVEYTANYIGSEVSAQVIREGSGLSLVHYSIEPSKVSVEEAGENYDVRFRLTGRVSDSAGKTVYQFDKDFPFSLTAAELEDVRSKSISIQDAFPLVPGSYNFDVLLKNTLSKEFMGAGMKVVIPEGAGAVRMSPLLLAYGDKKAPSPPGERVPFKTGDDQLLCQTRKVFSTNDSLVIFFQLGGLTEDLRTSGALLTTFFREDKEFLSRTAKVTAAKAETSVFDAQPLADFPPGYYQVRVSLFDGQGKEAVAAKENFEVSPAAAVPRPFVISKVVPSVKKEDDLFTTGVQYMNKGDLEAAKSRLAEAHGLDPRRVDLAVPYSQALFRLNDFLRVKEVLLPFAGGTEPVAEIPALLGQACHALGQFQEAVTYYAAYLSRFGANINILNFLGTCYFQLGNRAEAVKTWTKSLELSPNQEKIRALLESLKK
jgi:GWxTD domain-containing protein